MLSAFAILAATVVLAAPSPESQMDDRVTRDMTDPAFVYAGDNAFRAVIFLGDRMSGDVVKRRVCDDERNPKPGDPEAGDYAREIAESVIRGRNILPARLNYSKPGIASLGRMLLEFVNGTNLKDAADTVRYPAFTTFILRPKEIGYCVRTTRGSVLDRASSGAEAHAAGIRRIEVADDADADIEILYLYRPRHIPDRLREISVQVLPPDAQDIGKRFADEAKVLDGLNDKMTHVSPNLAPFTFFDVNAGGKKLLAARENQLPEDMRFPLQADMSFDMAFWRREIAANRRPPSLSDEQWHALSTLIEASPVLDKRADAFVLRVVTDRAQTKNRLVAPFDDPRRDGVVINFFVLDEISRLNVDKPAIRTRRLRLFSDLLAAAAVSRD